MLTFKCTGRARAAGVHAAPRAALIARRQLCTARCGSLTSSRLRHFPFALMGGRGSTKAFFLAPSLHRRRAGASAARPFFFCATKMQKRASIFMHLEPFCVQSVRVGTRGPGTDARRPRRRGKRDFCKYTAKKNPPQHLHDGPRAGS